MVQENSPEPRPPRKWVTTLYRSLAAGRYAALWLPELIELYGKIVEEEGEENAQKWLIDELSMSIRPSLVLRLYKLFRLLYLAWEAYRKVAKD